MNDLFGRRLARADRLLAVLENGLNLFAGLLVFGLMFLGVAQIILRTVFRAPCWGGARSTWAATCVPSWAGSRWIRPHWM